MKMEDNHEYVNLKLDYFEAERLCAALFFIIDESKDKQPEIIVRLSEYLDEYVNT